MRGERPRHSSSLTFGTWARSSSATAEEPPRSGVLSSRCGRIVGSVTRSKQGAGMGIRPHQRRSIGLAV
ncbi:hypothetical protein EF902_22400 [Streptomyces sp. WAC05858]|nr:hypothetical protein EF902_22400 [Streptomyces sp. WAC05858]